MKITITWYYQERKIEKKSLSARAADFLDREDPCKNCVDAMSRGNSGGGCFLSLSKPIYAQRGAIIRSWVREAVGRLVCCFFLGGFVGLTGTVCPHSTF